MWRQGTVLDLMSVNVDLVVQNWCASRGPVGLAGVEFGRGKKERGVCWRSLIMTYPVTGEVHIEA